MTDLQPGFEQSLLRLVRKADDSAPNWQDVLDRATAARRRTLLVTTLAAIFLVAGVSTGLAFGPDLWQIANGKPVSPAALSAQERTLLAEISSGRRILRTQPESPQLRDLGRKVSIRLLARRGQERVYLIQTRGRRKQTCVATGRAGAPHLFASVSCPLDAQFPSVTFPIFDQSVWGKKRGEPFRVLRLQGLAADGIAEVGLLVGDDVVARAPVRDNVYLRTTRLPKKAARAMVAIDRSGHRFYCPAAPPCFRDINDLEPLPPRPRPLPEPRKTPTPPRPQRHTFPLGRHLQHGEANGVSVDVYEPGAAVFHLHDLSRTTRRLLSGPSGASYSCLRVRFYQGRWLEDGLGTSGLVGSTFRLDLTLNVGRASTSPDLPPPYDGCEIGGLYGHRWNDAFGTRAAVEIPLTDAGRHYFNDRAAARDLAYFVRAGRVQRIRLSDNPRPALEALAKRFPRRIVELGSRDVFAGEDKIGFWIGTETLVFTSTSSTGRQFFVVAKRGTLKLSHTNLGDLAFVF